MAKRFTDTGKWGKEWFRKLPLKYKVLWDYLCGNCNQIGVWDVDMATASHFVGAKVTVVEALAFFPERIVPFEGGRKWFLSGFIPFQYGTLVPTNNFHKSLIASLERLSPLLDEAKKSGAAEPLPRGLGGVQYTDKDKDKVKGVQGVKTQYLDYVFLDPQEYTKLAEKMGPQREAFITRLNGYIGQIGPKKAATKYTSHYHTILNWYRKDVEDGTIRAYVPAAVQKPKPADTPPRPMTEEEQYEMHLETLEFLKKESCGDPSCRHCKKKTEPSKEPA